MRENRTSGTVRGAPGDRRSYREIQAYGKRKEKIWFRLTKFNRIKEILEDHVGKENQISSGGIGPEIGIHEDATHVQVRGLIRDAIEEFSLPVGGSSRGYYLIKDEKSLLSRPLKTIINFCITCQFRR